MTEIENFALAAAKLVEYLIDNGKKPTETSITK
jgi:hypothetical protein